MTKQDSIQAIVHQIRVFCAAHADPKQATRYQRFFREGYDAYGLHEDDPEWQAKKAEWFEQNSDIGLNGFLEVGRLLFQSGKYEEGMLAIHFVSRLKDQFSSRTLDKLAKWFEAGLPTWAHSDVLCGEILERFLQIELVNLEAFTRWRSSKRKFQRRAVPVTMLALLKRGAPVAPQLEFLRPMMQDGERVVQQGLGWFLREAWKKEPDTVEPFLLEWKNTAPRLIYQYATEKMTPEHKRAFRASAGRSS